MIERILAIENDLGAHESTSISNQTLDFCHAKDPAEALTSTQSHFRGRLISFLESRLPYIKLLTPPSQIELSTTRISHSLLEASRAFQPLLIRTTLRLSFTRQSNPPKREF